MTLALKGQATLLHWNLKQRTQVVRCLVKKLASPIQDCWIGLGRLVAGIKSVFQPVNAKRDPANLVLHDLIKKLE